MTEGPGLSLSARDAMFWGSARFARAQPHQAKWPVERVRDFVQLGRRTNGLLSPL